MPPNRDLAAIRLAFPKGCMHLGLMSIPLGD